MLRRLIVPIVSILSIVPIFPIAAIVPIVPRLSLWYRGQPPGIARAADLTAIRAAGFTAITWPAAQAAGLAEAARLASDADLEFIIRPAPVPLTPAVARYPDTSVDIAAARVAAAGLAPLVWRAIAHGARDISFDPGAADTRLYAPGAIPPGWLVVVGDIARQIRINGKVFADATLAADQPKIDAPVARDVDVVLLGAGRTWVLVATNTSGTRARVTARLPAGVPYAIWLNLLNGDTLAMLSEPAGPRWSFDLEGWGTRIYVIDKVLK